LDTFRIPYVHDSIAHTKSPFGDFACAISRILYLVKYKSEAFVSAKRISLDDDYIPRRFVAKTLMRLSPGEIQKRSFCQRKAHFTGDTALHTGKDLAVSPLKLPSKLTPKGSSSFRLKRLCSHLSIASDGGYPLPCSLIEYKNKAFLFHEGMSGLSSQPHFCTKNVCTGLRFKRIHYVISMSTLLAKVGLGNHLHKKYYATNTLLLQCLCNVFWKEVCGERESIAHLHAQR
jgi:hypothetical protein